ncbi:MAG TPA: hypothetical protein VH496_09830 [Mycobacterium sp.]|jgi:hypothetical protein
MTLMRARIAVALTGAGLAVALALGAAPAAHADVIDDLASEFTSAQGAGEISSLLNQSIKLRAAGFRLTNGEVAAIQDAMKDRPNQTPLIRALKEAVAGQGHRMQQAQVAAKQQGPFSIGINQYDPNSPGGVSVGPGGINFGGGPYRIGDGRSPGQAVGPPTG